MPCLGDGESRRKHIWKYKIGNKETGKAKEEKDLKVKYKTTRHYKKNT